MSLSLRPREPRRERVRAPAAPGTGGGAGPVSTNSVCRAGERGDELPVLRANGGIVGAGVETSAGVTSAGQCFGLGSLAKGLRGLI